METHHGIQAMRHVVSKDCRCASCAQNRRRLKRAFRSSIMVWVIAFGLFALVVFAVSRLPGAEEGHPEEPRSSAWHALEKKHLAEHPTCAVCGGREHLNVHHIRPFHLYPELELDPDNLITLCEGSTCNCHLFFGHLGDFKSYNLNIKADAARMLKARENRPYTRDPDKSKPRDHSRDVDCVVRTCFQQAA